METYIAFLRGINVSGKNPIKMDILKHHLVNDGLKDVITYIQSGNIIFKYLEIENNALADKLSQIIKLRFGLDVAVLIKKKEELGLIIKENPFISDVNNDVSGLHVTFLEKQPVAEYLEKISSIAFGEDSFQILNDIVYLHCPNGYGKTKLNNTFFENKLKLRATTRNWNTIINLSKLSEKI
jgi:uncharacterized protein (DUF1697 family)